MDELRFKETEEMFLAEHDDGICITGDYFQDWWGEIREERSTKIDMLWFDSEEQVREEYEKTKKDHFKWKELKTELIEYKK